MKHILFVTLSLFSSGLVIRVLFSHSTKTAKKYITARGDVFPIAIGMDSAGEPPGAAHKTSCQRDRPPSWARVFLKDDMRTLGLSDQLPRRGES